MTYILGKFQLDDVTGWKQMMESHRAAHKEAGLHFKQVWKNVQNPKQIYFIFEVEDLNRARSFYKRLAHSIRKNN